MPTAHKKLCGVALPATTLTALYSPASDTQAVISTIAVCNQGPTPATYRLAHAVAGAADAPGQYVLYDASLPANSTQALTIGVCLGPLDVLRAYASTDTLLVSAWGEERRDMPSVYKQLGGVALAAATVTPLYTVPADREVIVSSLCVCNRSATPTTFRLAHAVAGAVDVQSQYSFWDTPLPGNTTMTLTGGLCLGPGDVLRGLAAATVTMLAWGEERDL